MMMALYKYLVLSSLQAVLHTKYISGPYDGI